LVVAIELCTLARRYSVVIARHVNRSSRAAVGVASACHHLRPKEALGGELADPAHAFGGRVGVVAELLCHPAYAATDAELSHSPPDRLGHHFGGRGIRSLQFGGE
jgi:hypothetical protein